MIPYYPTDCAICHDPIGPNDFIARDHDGKPCHTDCYQAAKAQAAEAHASDRAERIWGEP